MVATPVFFVKTSIYLGIRYSLAGKLKICYGNLS
jgi:hypothetical protein